jgi:hypothetical protein
MKFSVEGRLKWLVEYTMATECSRIDGGDNKPRGCLLSANYYILVLPPVTYINQTKLSSFTNCVT